MVRGPAGDVGREPAARAGDAPGGLAHAGLAALPHRREARARSTRHRWRWPRRGCAASPASPTRRPARTERHAPAPLPVRARARPPARGSAALGGGAADADRGGAPAGTAACRGGGHGGKAGSGRLGASDPGEAGDRRVAASRSGAAFRPPAPGSPVAGPALGSRASVCGGRDSPARSGRRAVHRARPLRRHRQRDAGEVLSFLGGLGAHGPSAVGDMLFAFNAGVLVLAGFLLIWHAAAGVVDTAREGRFGFGAWAIVRIVTAIALMAPLPGGTQRRAARGGRPRPSRRRLRQRRLEALLRGGAGGEPAHRAEAARGALARRDFPRRSSPRPACARPTRARRRRATTPTSRSTTDEDDGIAWFSYDGDGRGMPDGMCGSIRFTGLEADGAPGPRGRRPPPGAHRLMPADPNIAAASRRPLRARHAPLRPPPPGYRRPARPARTLAGHTRTCSTTR